HLVHMIAEAEGWISFADYMHAVLYAPGLGYYTSGARKLGVGGDFVTAPELTPLFGRTLAAQAEERALPERYLLLEVSPELRQRQRELLAARVPGVMPRVVWIDTLPE